jgi:hypothetical protein
MFHVYNSLMRSVSWAMQMWIENVSLLCFTLCDYDDSCGVRFPLSVYDSWCLRSIWQETIITHYRMGYERTSKIHDSDSFIYYIEYSYCTFQVEIIDPLHSIILTLGLFSFHDSCRHVLGLTLTHYIEYSA